VREGLEEVRRSNDGELEGFIRPVAAGFEALTVFHGVLGRTSSAEAARAVVHARGLASLADHWYWWSRIAREWRVVLPQEARPGFVRIALGYYALAGVPTAIVTADDLALGDVLTIDAPNAPVEGLPGQ
jgi:hypothetical protein